MVPIKFWTDEAEVEAEAKKQLHNIASLPWVFKHVAVMPDVHFGKGATVGSVIAMKDAVSPAAVGVDIGCGMAAVKTNLKASDLPDSLRAIRNQIERDIPVGFNQHGGVDVAVKAEVEAAMTAFPYLSAKVQDLQKKATYQIGTLGGGNHFIELCLDQNQDVWMMLHSGSRNIGKTLAEIHISKAKALAHNADLPDPDLAVFLASTPEMAEYRRDLTWAQEYAKYNRLAMMKLYIRALQRFFPEMRTNEAIWCHHNYVSEESHFGENVLVTRKGAISARLGEWGIIPGSMGARSFIVQGKGHPESYHSASHGAGRKMSRGAARRAFKKEDLEKQTLGVECRKDEGVIDEIPEAYKDIQKVIDYQKDLIEVKYELKQVLCVKG